MSVLQAMRVGEEGDVRFIARRLRAAIEACAEGVFRPFPFALAAGLFLATLAGNAVAQDQAAGGSAISPEAMKVLVAPVALYPDDVLAVVLPASTTGLQVVEAQRYLDKHKTDASLQPNPNWDPSILAILNYPDVVARLNADLDWTSRLGDAVIDQQADVMTAIQQIRNEAVAAGYLKSDGKIVVTQNQQTVIIQSADPQLVYVPNYDPQVIVQQTYVVAPPPVYYNPYPPYYSPAATFVTGIVVGGALAYAFDWDHHDIDVDVHYHDDGHHDNGHHDNDHHDNDHHDGGRDNDDHHGQHNDFSKYNIDRQPGQNGGKMTWNGGQKRPTTEPAVNNRPAGLAPASPGTARPGKLPAPAGQTGAAKGVLPPNRVGNVEANGKPAGGFGAINSGQQTYQQWQRGQQSLQQRGPVQQRNFQAPRGNSGAFNNNRMSGSGVAAQQRRGGGSRGVPFQRR
jgi:hypothetical protein